MTGEVQLYLNGAGTARGGFHTDGDSHSAMVGWVKWTDT
jgi:hypothetical protein